MNKNSKPFKFRYVNEIVGGFVLAVLAGLVIVVIIAGNAQRWFEPVHHIKLLFPPEGSLDLQRGAEVRILGATVGSLIRIDVEEDGSMTGEITVTGDFIRFVRQDSKAIARKVFGVAGDAYVDITHGTGEKLPDDFPALECVKDTELIETLQQIAEELEARIFPILDEVKEAVQEYKVVAHELHDPEGNLQKLLANINAVVEGLERGDGTAGKFLKDPALAEEMHQITSTVNESLAEVREILADVKRATSQLPDMAETVGGEVRDASGLVSQTQDALRETQKLIEGLQRHVLIRGYIEQGGEIRRLNPSSAGLMSGDRK